MVDNPEKSREIQFDRLIVGSRDLERPNIRMLTMFGCFGLPLTDRIFRLTARDMVFECVERHDLCVNILHKFHVIPFIVQILAVLYNLYCMK